jgi:hypothetical protein
MIVALCAAAACSAQDSATIQITLGDQADALATSTSIEIDAVGTSGTPTVLATASLPASTIDLGSQSEGTGEVVLEVKGLNAQQTVNAFGTSIPLLYSAIVGEPLPLFVQRVGEFAGMPGPFTDARQAPVMAIVQGQYLFVAGGSLPVGVDGGVVACATSADGGVAETSPTLTTQLYDFSQFAPLGAPPSMPGIPASLAFAGTVGWLINGAGGTYYDLGSDSAVVIPTPPGASFSDVAGGATVTDDNGAQYIVGATRTSGAATQWVLKVDPNDTSNTNYPYGNPTWFTLFSPRLGASATWVSGLGLVVAGGSATASGVEIIGPSSTTGSPLNYPPDPSVGAGAATLDPTHILVAGGILPGGLDAGARSLDLSCRTSTCAPTLWAALPVAIGTAQSFTFSATDALVVGNEPVSGRTHAFRLSMTGAGDGGSTTSASNDLTEAGAIDSGATEGGFVDSGAPPAIALGTATEVVIPAPPTNADGTLVPPGDAGCGTGTGLVNATAIWSPVGSVVVFGGSSTIESFRIAP